MRMASPQDLRSLHRSSGCPLSHLLHQRGSLLIERAMWAEEAWSVWRRSLPPEKWSWG